MNLLIDGFNEFSFDLLRNVQSNCKRTVLFIDFLFGIKDVCLHVGEISMKFHKTGICSCFYANIFKGDFTVSCVILVEKYSLA